MRGDRKQVEGAGNQGGQRELPGKKEGFSRARWAVVERGGGEGLSVLNRQHTGSIDEPSGPTRERVSTASLPSARNQRQEQAPWGSGT